VVGRSLVRDTRKDARYFDEQARHNEEWLEKVRGIIASPDTAPNQRRMLRHAVYRRELEQLIARYSRGERVEALRAAFPRTIDALAEYQQQADNAAQDFDNFDAYILALWIMALAVLLDVGDDETRRAAQELGNSGRDAIFDRLLALRLPGQRETRTLMYPRPYGPLRDALDASGDEQSRKLTEFLDGWYDGMEPAYWQGSHTGSDAGYFGYWSFELAAFVKQLGINDSAFADNLYYPSDLVHCSRGEAK
jgi:hypothetical protein